MVPFLKFRFSWFGIKITTNVELHKIFKGKIVPVFFIFMIFFFFCFFNRINEFFTLNSFRECQILFCFVQVIKNSASLTFEVFASDTNTKGSSNSAILPVPLDFLNTSGVVLAIWNL